MTFAEVVIALGAVELLSLVAALAAMVFAGRAPLRLDLPARSEAAPTRAQDAA